MLTDGAGAIVASGRNRVSDAEAPPGRLRSTYLAHAEIDALAQLPHGDYPDHTLWTTLEPCLMCASAVVLSHVGTVRYAAADPLWSGIDRLPKINAQAARRWPIRQGPLSGPLGAFCGLLPLVWAIRQKCDGVVARAYEAHDPALLCARPPADRRWHPGRHARHFGRGGVGAPLARPRRRRGPGGGR